MRNLIPVFFLALSACPGPECEEGDECETDSETDTSIDPDAVGSLLVQPTWLGNPLACTINAVGPVNQSWDVGTEPTPYELPAGQYSLGVGSGNFGGVTGHILPDGQVVVSRAVDAEVQKDAESTAPLPLNAYFDGEYVCNVQVWQYDASKPDHKGQSGNQSDPDPKQRVQVEMGYKVKPYGDADFHGFLQGDMNWLEVNGDKLVLHMEDGNPYNIFLQASKIEKDAFEVEIVAPNINVARNRCEK
jgi:hypothetical protein